MAKPLKLEVLLGAIDKATGPLKKITQGSGATAQALKASKNQLRELQQQQKDVRGYREAAIAMRGNQQALKKLADQTAQYTEQQEEQKERHGRIQTSLKNARREYDRLAKAVQDTSEPNAALSYELDKARIRLNAQQQAADESSGSLKKLRERLRDADQHTQHLNQSQRTQQERLAGLTRRLEDAGIGTDNLKRSAMRLEDQEAKLNRTLEAQQTRLKRIAEARERLSRVRGAGSGVVQNGGATIRNASIAGGIAGVAVGGLAHSFATEGEELRQWSARLGIATEELSRLQYVGSQYGVQNDAMIDALKELSLRTDEFAETAAGPAAEAFERLGFDPQTLKQASGDTSALFDMVLGRLREVENVAARQRIVDEIFGGQGGEQLAELASVSAKELKRLREESDALGNTFNDQDIEAAHDYMQAWRGAQGALRGVRNVLGREIAPQLKILFDQFSGWVRENRDEVRRFARELGNGLRDAVPIFLDLVRGAASFARTAGAITQKLADMVGGFDNLAGILATVFAMKTITSVIAFGGALFGLVGGVGALSKAIPVLTGLMTTLNAVIRANPIGFAAWAFAVAAGLIIANWEPISAFFQNLWDRLGSAFNEGIGATLRLLLNWNPIAWIYRAITAGLAAMGVTIADDFRSLGGAIIDGIIGGIDMKWQELKDKITGLGGWMTGWFKDDQEIHSPSRVWAKLGDHTMAGLAQGIDKGADAPLKNVVSLSKRLKQAGAGIAIGATAAMPAVADIPIDRRPAMSASAPAAQTVGDINININATPGMNEQALARYVAAEVQRALAQAERDAGARRRSSLRDID